MMRSRSPSHRSRRSRSLDDVICNIPGRSREELERRRKEWKIEQDRAKDHERLKRKKIEEYERKRAAMLKEQEKESKKLQRSLSPAKQENRRVEKTIPMSQKLQPDNLSEPIFSSPNGRTDIDKEELRRITVDIKRKISVPPQSVPSISDLRREIVNPEDVLLKRREGEGSKPIFDRDELKHNSAAIEEERTVRVKDTEKHSVSLRKSNDYSPKTSYHSRNSRYDNKAVKSDRDDRQSKHYRREAGSAQSSERSRRLVNEEDKKYVDHRLYRSRRSRSYSPERRDRHRSSPGRESRRSSRKSRDGRRSRERTQEREEHYRYDNSALQQPPMNPIMPYTTYYPPYAARHMMPAPGPMMPMQPPLGPMPHMRYHSSLRPPCPPRFMPRDPYRMNFPSTSRFGGMY